MSVLIIGGGQAGLQVADSLRSEGYSLPITVVADEAQLPYQRPPLSKDYLKSGGVPEPMPLRGPAFFAEHDITLIQGFAAASVDRANRTVALDDGRILGYTYLVFATGASNRRLSCPGASLPGVHGLRTLDDARRLHESLIRATNVVVVGAGFIGMEFAAAARSHGCRTTVLSPSDRPMARTLSPNMARWFIPAHERLGVELHLGQSLSHVEPDARGKVGAVVSESGQRHQADLVVAGIGVTPNDQIAAESGLDVQNGILVDEQLRTSDPRILAVGDCANFPNPRGNCRSRIESVQNATDQGRHAARTILGLGSEYNALPWFWSTQGPYRLQIAGLVDPRNDTLVLGDPLASKFSVLGFRDNQLVAVESMNRPADHMAARALLGSGHRITRELARSRGFSLKSALRDLTPLPA